MSSQLIAELGVDIFALFVMLTVWVLSRVDDRLRQRRRARARARAPAREHGEAAAIMLPEPPRAIVMLSNLILTGPVTGHQHERLWPRAATRYALAAFQQSCALGHASWPGALDELTPEAIHQRWVPLRVRYGFVCLGMQSELLETRCDDDAVRERLLCEVHTDGSPWRMPLSLCRV